MNDARRRRLQALPLLTVSLIVALLMTACDDRAEQRSDQTSFERTVTGTVRDPKDTDGRLDVVGLRHGTEGDEGGLWHSVRLSKEWEDSLLQPPNYLLIEFSTDEKKRDIEYRIPVRYEQGELQASIETYEQGSDFGDAGFIREIELTRSSDYAFTVFFNEKDLGNPETYSWSVYTRYLSERGKECRRGCSDHAPPGMGVGRFEHDLSG